MTDGEVVESFAIAAIVLMSAVLVGLLRMWAGWIAVFCLFVCLLVGVCVCVCVCVSLCV